MGACPSCRASGSLVEGSFDILIVGGGNAAGYVCRELASAGARRVGVICEESVPPYERPALTKAYLHPPTAKVRARLPAFHTCVGAGGELQDRAWYAAQGIRLLAGTATGLDAGLRTVSVGGECYCYEKLIIATGARSLRLSEVGVANPDLKNVFYIRAEHDAALLVQAMEALPPSAHVAVVGGGYIGLECAAALRGWGFHVTLLASDNRVLPRLFNPDLARWLEDEYSSRGVVVRTGARVTELTGNSGIVTGIKLQGGEHLPCHLLVVGVGSVPNLQWCTGLRIEHGGIAVDTTMRASNEHIFAVGDVCAFPSQRGNLVRCEHVDHARKSAAQAAKAALGLAPEPYKYLPYFYSRVFEYTNNPIVFNFFGDSYGECRALRRHPNSIAALWEQDGRVAGGLLMGSPGPSKEDADKLRALVQSRPPAGHPEAVLAAAGL